MSHSGDPEFDAGRARQMHRLERHTARQPVTGPGRPDPRTPLLRCGCVGAYLDDPPSRAAHYTVFGHRPRPPEPAPPEPA